MIMWWQFELVANAVISVAYLAIATLIAVPLVRTHQVRSNKLALATAAIFFSSSVGHGLHALEHVFSLGQGDHGGMAGSTGSWGLAVWHSLTAAVGVYYLSLRGLYGRLLANPTMFDDLHEQQRLSELEKLEAEMTARISAESDRDFYLHMMNTINANNPALIFAKDLEGRYLMVNEAYERALDLRAEDLIGRTDEVVNAELAPSWRASDLRARRGRYQVDEIGEGPAGLRYYDSVKFPLFDTRGELYATCGVSMDVTGLRRTNEALVEARDHAVAAVAVKSAFLATMSHELRTPLNAVIGMTDLLLHTSLDAEQEELVATVHTSGDALLAVIDDILDFSRLESSGPQLRPAPFGLREEIRQAAAMVAVSAPPGVEVVCQVDDSCPASAVGDRDRIRQILVNVLANAVKFTPRGEIRLTAHSEPLAEGGLRVVVDVRDTGIGISPEGLDKLFISFSQVDASATRSYGGTGLGLAISRRLARAMDGDITVVSTPGEGSTFTVAVVVQPDTGQDAHPPQPRLRPAVAQRLQVLVAEDNLANQRVAQLMLRQLGHTVETVSNGEEAVEAVLAGNYDVVLMDLQMPGLDGVAATRRIRAEAPAERQPHIIAMTASVLDEDRLASAAAGAETYLPKPVRLAALREALEGVSQLAAPDQAASQPGRGPLDESVLHQLREDLDDGDGSAVEELVESSLQGLRTLLPELTAALRHGDGAVAAEMAHAFSSSSRLLGATGLTALLGQVQEAVARGAVTPLECQALAAALDHESQRVVEALTSSRGPLARARGDAITPG